jgi:hypothetical protein
VAGSGQYQASSSSPILIRDALANILSERASTGCGLYPAGPAAILHRPDPIMIVAEPSFVVELA